MSVSSADPFFFGSYSSRIVRYDSDGELPHLRKTALARFLSSGIGIGFNRPNELGIDLSCLFNIAWLFKDSLENEVGMHFSVPRLASRILATGVELPFVYESQLVEADYLSYSQKQQALLFSLTKILENLGVMVIDGVVYNMKLELDDQELEGWLRGVAMNHDIGMRHYVRTRLGLRYQFESLGM